MNRFDAIAAALPQYGLDGILLTGAANRFYATGFAADEEGGIALVTTKGNFFFTDSRYIEAAEAHIENAAIGLVDAQKRYIAWINEALELARAYSTPEAVSFINGVLGTILRRKEAAQA